ncbi:MAG TPA: ATP-dependent DNA helicase, partial [Candidatus Paceibacterota bacterium]|nr:ATP-dependent DNA helicase [Candidatus Paceibacterota bacterium]
MATDSFSTLYKRLNPAQKKAVDTIEGPVMVIAGPGTGKTQILTLRMANILKKTDTAPDSILALTFTESGVSAMRARLVAIMGAEGYRVHIHTFHGFANEIIRRFPEEFPKIIGGEALTETEQISLMESVLTKCEGLELLRPWGDPLYYVKPALSAIEALKRENVDAERFAALVKKQEKEYAAAPDKTHAKGRYKGEMKGEFRDLAKQIAKNRELLLIYEEYEKALAKRRRYDYADMLLELIRALERSTDFLRTLQEEYQYLLADEHQDANGAQNRILELLSEFHESPNLFIVGDEKQAIFRFQGASLENFLYFKEKYPKAEVIALTSNYRSGQLILDSAHSLMAAAGADQSLRVPLSAHKKEAARLVLREYPDTPGEAAGTAASVAEALAEGVAPSEIAILFRHNDDAGPLAEALARQGVRYRIEAERNILENREIRKLLALARAVAEPTDPHIGELIFLDFLGLPTLDAYKLLAYARTLRAPLLELMTSTRHLKEAGVGEPAVWQAFGEKMLRFASLAKNQDSLHALEEIFRDSGFLRELLSRADSAELLERCHRLFAEAREALRSDPGQSLSGFLAHLDMLSRYALPIRYSPPEDPQAVRLMTAHRAKGLEFERVYITGSDERSWGGGRNRAYFKLPIAGIGAGGIEDERRLFYVALTRAKREVILSYAKRSGDGRENAPSRFLSEIDPVLLTREETVLAEISERSFAPTPLQGPSVADREYLRERFFAQGLSVSALNNYLECPWRYFFVNLVRLPQVETKHQLYGTAMHKALSETLDALNKGRKISLPQLIASFERALEREPLSGADQKAALTKGKKALTGYWNEWRKSWKAPVFAEYAVKGVEMEIPSG